MEHDLHKKYRICRCIYRVWDIWSQSISLFFRHGGFFATQGWTSM